MRFVTNELQSKINDGTATNSEVTAYELLSLLGDAGLTPEDAAQKLLQAAAVCDARAKGHHDTADALLELFSTNSATAHRTENGFEFKLTDVGLAQGAALVHKMAGGKTQ